MDYFLIFNIKFYWFCVFYMFVFQLSYTFLFDSTNLFLYKMTYTFGPWHLPILKKNAPRTMYMDIFKKRHPHLANAMNNVLTQMDI